MNSEPFNEVLQHWKNSYSIRKITTSKCVTIEQFYKDWPILKTQFAPELVAYDFQQRFEIQLDDVDEAFQHFFDKLLEVRRKNLTDADETILSQLDCQITTGMYTYI